MAKRKTTQRRRVGAIKKNNIQQDAHKILTVASNYSTIVKLIRDVGIPILLIVIGLIKKILNKATRSKSRTRRVVRRRKK